MTDLSAWTKANVTALNNQTDPILGRSYARVTCAATTGTHYILSPASGAVAANGSFDIYVRPGSGTGWIAILVSSTPDNQILWINPATKEAYGQKCAGGIVEEFADGFYHIQGHALNGGVASNLIIYVNAVNSGLDGLSVTSTCTGTEYIDIASPTIIDSTLPLGDEYKFHAYVEETTADGILRHRSSTPYCDTVASMNTNLPRLDVLVPSAYSAANEYNLVICLGVEATPGTSYPAELPIIKNAGLHNTHDTIVVQWANRTAFFPWWGVKNTGENDHERVIVEQVIPWVRARYNIKAGRAGVGLMGWSKGGWGALSLILRNSDAIGFVGIWDTDYNEAFDAAGAPNDYGEEGFFGTEAQFLLHNPKTILAANLAAINDKARLFVSGAARFVTDTQSLRADLLLHGIPHSYDFHDATGGEHTSSFGWIAGDGVWGTTYGGDSVFAGLVGLMDYVEPSPPAPLTWTPRTAIAGAWGIREQANGTWTLVADLPPAWGDALGAITDWTATTPPPPSWATE